MGSVIALHLSKRGYQVVLVTPAGRACSWGEYTDEQVSSNLALYNAGVEVITNKTIINVQNGSVQARCIYSSKIDLIECDKVIPLTRRIPRVGLYHDLIKEYQVKDDKSRLRILKIGDADSPSHIAAAIYSAVCCCLLQKAFQSGPKATIQELLPRQLRGGVGLDE